MGKTCKQHDKNTIERVEKGYFKPGKSANPAGRAKGSKNKFTGLKDQYLEGIEIAAKAGGLAGVAAWLAAVAEKDAVAYAKIVAGLIPKESKVDVTQRTADEFGKALENMPEDELRRWARAVKTEDT